MNVLAAGLSYVDLNFLGVPRIIATVVLHGPGGVALIDPGPSSTLPALRTALEQAGIAMTDLRAILLTHIHLDHAGATGTLVHQNPGLRVYVHEKGARHMEPELADGDIVVVHYPERQPALKLLDEHALVVVTTQDGSDWNDYLKRYNTDMSTGEEQLISTNPAYGPLAVRPKEVRFVGSVKMIVHKD